MDLLKSNCKVVLGGSIIVNRDVHYMQFEPELDHQLEVQPVRALRATHGRVIKRGNAINTFTFSRVEKHKSHPYAISRMLYYAEVWPTLAGGDCVIQLGPFSALYEHNLANAAIVSAPCKVVNEFTYHTIKITGGELSTLGTPP